MDPGVPKIYGSYGPNTAQIIIDFPLQSVLYNFAKIRSKKNREYHTLIKKVKSLQKAENPHFSQLLKIEIFGQRKPPHLCRKTSQNLIFFATLNAALFVSTWKTFNPLPGGPLAPPFSGGPRSDWT
jgi:hypothetical protein